MREVTRVVVGFITGDVQGAGTFDVVYFLAFFHVHGTITFCQSMNFSPFDNSGGKSIFNVHFHVFLSMHKELFGIFFVLQPDLVASRSLGR